MPRPSDKASLLELATRNFNKLTALIEGMPQDLQEAVLPYNERDKRLRDILIHLYEWQNLLLNFVSTNIQKSSDFVSFLPAPYNFKTYPQMNKQLWHKHQGTPLETAKARLYKSHSDCLAMIESLPQETLFLKKHYQWCGNTSLGSYCVSATSSHYDWAIKTIKKTLKNTKINV